MNVALENRLDVPTSDQSPSRFVLERDAVETFLKVVESRRQVIGETRDPSLRLRYGQYFTPSQAADLIVMMVQLPEQGDFNVLDPGAGSGSLTAALVARIVREAPQLNVSVLAVEIDPTLRGVLECTVQDCQEIAASHGVSLAIKVVTDDLVDMATGWDRSLFKSFDLVIMNPPYKKLAANSRERRALTAVGIDSPNLYSTFLSIGSLALLPGGQLVAITPRSFANGPYFGSFRRFLLSEISLNHIHVFESRSTVFADSGVLQENIVFSARRWSVPSEVTVSISHGHRDDVIFRTVPYSEIIKPEDRNQFIHIPTSDIDTELTETFSRLPCTIRDTGIEVSTGRVVDFRARSHLLTEPADNAAPLIYPGNIRSGRVEWPREIRKPKALASNAATAKLVLPNGRFVLVKRFSSKEERRRIVAAVYEPVDAGRHGVGFENHLNVFHANGRGLDQHLAYGLCLWLNSSVVDRFFRTFSGHTQVNATDLRSLRYPSPSTLEILGSSCNGVWPDQEQIDFLVASHVFAGLL